MEDDLGSKGSITLSEVRIILIGGTGSGKSSSGNTLLGRERFECGRTRTTQSELRHELVEGRVLGVLDTPGWSTSLFLAEIPEADKQKFKLHVSRCLPGPHVFLVVVPIDTPFTKAQRKTLEEHMKLLGERVWANTVVLFTRGDSLEGMIIERHLESGGEELLWLVEECRHRYHVFDNKDKGNVSQVTSLLEMIDEMVWQNGCYEVDEALFQMVEIKQREAAQRGARRLQRTQEQSSQIPEAPCKLPELRLVLLGSRHVGKTSVGNTILGIKDQSDGKRTTQSVVRQGYVNQTSVMLVDTPGWWRDLSVRDTPELIKQEVTTSLFKCRPGPHAFLLVIDADASFDSKHREVTVGHLELLGEHMWRYAMVVFTRGDWLGAKTIEEHIEGEGGDLRAIVDKCGNRYHVLDNKNAHDGIQVVELLEKIHQMLAMNGRNPFVPDKKLYLSMEDKKKAAEEGVKVREAKVGAEREIRNRSRNELQDIRVVMLGPKTAGKSASGNILLGRCVFVTHKTERCQDKTSLVGGQLITVIDTPGWWNDPAQCTQEMDREIVRGVSLSPLGVHAVLLVVSLDATFTEAHRRAVEEHVGLFDDSIWIHTLLLFSYGDVLGDVPVEEYIEKEGSSLKWLVEKCQHRYHVLDNTKTTDEAQVTRLYELIEGMVPVSGIRPFKPDLNDVYQRLEEKFKRKEVKRQEEATQRLELKYRMKELELMAGFRQTLVGLQKEIGGRETPTSSVNGGEKPTFRKMATIIAGGERPTSPVSGGEKPTFRKMAKIVAGGEKPTSPVSGGEKPTFRKMAKIVAGGEKPISPVSGGEKPTFRKMATIVAGGERRKMSFVDVAKAIGHNIAGKKKEDEVLEKRIAEEIETLDKEMQRLSAMSGSLQDATKPAGQQEDTPKPDIMLQRRLSTVIGLQPPADKPPKTKAHRPSVLSEEIQMF